MDDDSSILKVYPGCKVEWLLEKFLSLRPSSIYSKSSKYFRFLNISWRFKVFHHSPSKPEKLVICLERNTFWTKELRLGVTVGIKKVDGSVFYSMHRVLEFNSGVSSLIASPMDRAALLKSKDNCLPNGDLTLVCHLNLEDDPVSESNFPYSNHSILSQNLEDLFLSERESDVIIKVKGKQFKSHRSILVARSVVFATMFAQDMSERHSGIVDINDCDPDSFREFLLYLYTGKTDQVTSYNAPILYNIADKYSVDKLKMECMEFMSQNMSVNSICDVLIVASRHFEPNLLQSATDFFLKNMKEILMTKNWDDFQSQHFSLSKDLLLKAADLMKM